MSFLPVSPGRRGALTSDWNGVDETVIDATIGQRKAFELHTCKGDRFYAWKKGRGKAVARELLFQPCPTPESPVTIVRVTVNGVVVAKAVRRWL